MNIVVAGSSGFLGSRFKSFFSKKYSIFDYKKKIPKKIDIVINMAGPDSKFCSNNIELGISQRILINKKILQIIKKFKVKKYFYISTIHVYKKNKLINENSRLDEINPYSKSHIESEKFILNYFPKTCDIKILRLANCFGYNKNLKSNSWNLVLNNIIKNIFLKKVIKINSNQNFQRDFVPITYLFYILEFLFFKKSNKKIFNISSEETKSIFQICKDIKKIYEKLFAQKIQIKKKFNQHHNKNKIKSKLMNAHRQKKLNQFYYHDIEELIIFCQKNFIK